MAPLALNDEGRVCHMTGLVDKCSSGRVGCGIQDVSTGPPFRPFHFSLAFKRMNPISLIVALHKDRKACL